MTKKDVRLIKKFISNLNPKIKLEKKEIDRVNKMTDRGKLKWLANMRKNEGITDALDEMFSIKGSCGGSNDTVTTNCSSVSCDGGGNWGSGYGGID